MEKEVREFPWGKIIIIIINKSTFKAGQYMVCIYSETPLFCWSSGKVLLNMPKNRLVIARAAGKHSLKENQTHGLKAKTGHYSHLFQPDAQVGHRISSTELCSRENKCWVWMA